MRDLRRRLAPNERSAYAPMSESARIRDDRRTVEIVERKEVPALVFDGDSA